ncbi:MAG: hypothetical protein QXE45_04550 [Thermoplasmata archaeon]
MRIVKVNSEKYRYHGVGIILFPNPDPQKVDVFLIPEGVTITVDASEVEEIHASPQAHEVR